MHTLALLIISTTAIPKIDITSRDSNSIFCGAFLKISYNSNTQIYNISWGEKRGGGPKKKKQTYYYYFLRYSDLTKINTKIRKYCESQLITGLSPADIYNKLIATNRPLDNAGR
jgi:hypothetical protein